MNPDAPRSNAWAADDPRRETIDRLCRAVGALVEGQPHEVIAHVMLTLVCQAVPDLPTARPALRRIARLANALADGLDDE